MSREWDPDPETPHIEVVIQKTGRMVGLKAGDAKGPQDYPFVQMIGVGTPVDLCQEIDIGDRIKCINGAFLKGKKRSEVHKLVREVPIDADIIMKVVKSFKDKKFITDMGNAGFRVASVRRTNPLLAMGDMDGGGMGALGEEEEEAPTPDEPIQEDVIGEEEASPSAFARRGSTTSFDGFGDDEPTDMGTAAPEATGGKSFGGFKRKASVYGGFGGEEEEPAAAPAGDASGVNTIDVDGQEFGFSEMSLDGDDDGWG